MTEVFVLFGAEYDDFWIEGWSDELDSLKRWAEGKDRRVRLLWIEDGTEWWANSGTRYCWHIQKTQKR